MICLHDANLGMVATSYSSRTKTLHCSLNSFFTSCLLILNSLRIVNSGGCIAGEVTTRGSAGYGFLILGDTPNCGDTGEQQLVFVLCLLEYGNAVLK